MRVALLIVLLLVPAGLAQTQVLEDNTGDATASIAGNSAPGVDPASFDLVGLWVHEETDAFRFVLQVSDIDPPNPVPTDTGLVDIDFNHADQAYRLRLLRDTTTGANAFGGQFLAYEAGRGDYVYHDRLVPTIDGSQETATFTVPRTWLLDGNGTAPTIGRDFDYFRAFARNTNVFNSQFAPNAVQVRDAMPDSGYGAITYPIQLGLQQTGHAFLESSTPVRASNGEKGTFVYYVRASNLDPAEDKFTLSVRDVPKDWEVTLPGGSIRLAGNETRAFPVLLSVPFAHQHGVFENFILEMKSQSRSSSVGRLELGIRYLEVPQPAGHHDRVHIHTISEAAPSGSLAAFAGDTQKRAYFNTLEDDENDDDTAVPPFGGQLSAGRQQFTWQLYLEPGLEMGLDFDLNRTGAITAQFRSEVSIYTATFSGYLMHVQGETVNGQFREAKKTVVATIPPSSPQSVGQGTSFESLIRATKASDLIPFNKNAALMLVLNMTVQDGQQLLGGQTTDPLLTGGQFTLPLNEYRDSLEGVFNSLAGLRFVNKGLAERPVNPGETVLFNLTLTNDGAVDDVFALRVNGTNGAWARVLGDKEIFVPTGASRPVVVAVSAPKDAPHLDVADLIVTAASKAEPTILGNIRVVALVDDVLDHPDESHLVAGIDDELASKKKSPGAPVMVLTLALAGIVALMRKQRA